MRKIERLYLYVLGLPKTILFNLKYLPFKDAIRLPILVSHRVWLEGFSGKVKVHEVRTGAITIGFGDIGIFDQHRSRTIWQVYGLVEFKGRANIGHGSKICVPGTLVIGKNFNISAESTIIAQDHITIGDDVVFSWDTLIMDTDLHKIFDSDGVQTNAPRPIVIGHKVWVGCRTLILKGVTIADGVVIAASSVVTKSIDTKNSIIGGNPAKVLKKDVTWQV